MSTLRGLVVRARLFDGVNLLLSAVLILGAYVVAYAYVAVPNEILDAPKVSGLAMVFGAWSVLALFLFAAFAAGLSSGRPWNRALPDGYTGSLAAALVFGAAWIVDETVWSPLSNSVQLGLETLFTPPHLVEMAAAAVIVSGPLRAAARRGEVTATTITLGSAALLLSVMTFATQFIHPLIDPWAAASYPLLVAAPKWLGENIGMAGLLVQSAILAGTGLLLNTGFRLRPGSLTLVFTLNGLLVATTKTNYALVPIAVATGVLADAWVVYTSRRPGRPSASLCGIIGGGFAVAYLIEVSFMPSGSDWGVSLWSGAICAATMMNWMFGRLLRAGLPQPSSITVAATSDETGVLAQWTLDPDSAAREQIVRSALDDLGTPEALGRNPLGRLPGVSKSQSAAADLRALLVDVVSELAGSGSPRDAEAGRLLLDYYVKKAGSHEVIMERLHLSRPTYYRRLHHGFRLVADRLDELSEFAGRVPVGS